MGTSLACLGFFPEFGGVLRAAREMGMDVTSLCAFHEHETWWGRSQIWGRVMQAVRVEGFPIRVAQRISIRELGPLGVAAQVAPDLRSGLQSLIDHQHVFTGAALARMRDDVARGTTILEHLYAGELDLGWRCRNEMSMANAVQFARELCGRWVRPRRVCFGHTGPRDPREHEAFFDCEVRFDAGSYSLEFDRDTLAIPLPGADAHLSRFLARHLRTLGGASLPSTPIFEERVQETILGRLGNESVAMADVARELGMSTRTLSRRLVQQGTGYHEILDRVRRELADELLGDRERKLSEVALRLGFSETSAFHRAYVRWTGRTPAETRTHAA